VPAQPPFRLPNFIYGIAYDTFGFVIYSFFPRIMELGDGGFPRAWGYGCATVDAGHSNVFGFNDLKERLNAIRALLVVQRHAITLSKKLADVFIPQALLECHQLWDKNKLW